jgi:aerobic carbon-monoxide dehydrogenase medium subunit
MKFYPLEYLSPTTVAETVAMWREHPEAMFVAGGQGLLYELRLGYRHPTCLIDLSGVSELHRAHSVDDGAMLAVGSCMTLAELAATSLEGTGGLVSKAASGVAVGPIRTLATAGGNFFHGSPTAEIPLAIMACGGAAVVLDSSGETRRLTGLELRSMRPERDTSVVLLTHLEVPLKDGLDGWDFFEVGEQGTWVPVLAAALAIPTAGGEAQGGRIAFAVRDGSAGLIQVGGLANRAQLRDEVRAGVEEAMVQSGFSAEWVAEILVERAWTTRNTLARSGTNGQ